ncbi:molybdopterin-dependent oxidoreductase [Cognatishimia activa]|uniref:Oxidoreductase n=1 Tax=Cognatishimia activa TaxID=1715691 RepID=A0A975ERH9_9RHOB|nr:molybdopterin-dependent oxidoreductase [Cognatishimia activa]QTN36532.1 oxidoreductase [Cognatishimia activa]
MKNLFAIALLIVCSAAASVAEISQPKGEVILEISGEISSKNVAETAQFDLEMLQALPSHSFVTSTIWTDGAQSFEGVELSVIADLVGFEGDTLSASAVNDYTIEIPIADAAPGRAMIAYMRNGNPMPLRDKGPLWIVYPFDSSSDFQSETIYSRSIWQLNRIAVSNSGG